MKKFFHSHPDVVIAVLAIVFLAMLIAFYSWAINDVVLEVHQALNSSQSESVTSFDLTDAAKLNLRQLTASSTVIIVATTTPAAATTTATTTAASSSTAK
jgi:hypothetical protein